MLTFEELRNALDSVFPVQQDRPRLFQLVEPIALVRAGELSARDAARTVHSTTRRMEALSTATDPIDSLLGPIPEFTVSVDGGIRSNLGQLLIGAMAERVFLESWISNLPGDDLVLRDDRRARGDTDFLVDDKTGRQIFRLNIKFHGASFRRAMELVGLAPEDTFALATYKIHSALEKQESEHLPYIFVIVGVRGLAAGQVGELIPDRLVRLVALAHASSKVTGKRSIEDAVVTRVLEAPAQFGVAARVGEQMEQLRAAEWRVISARRAEKLLRELLFKRAYALRVRGFARNFGGAELDMHFSVSADLHPLNELVEILRDHGMPGLVSRLERGTL